MGGGVSGGIWGHGGVSPHVRTRTHACTHACTHTHTHTCIELQMAASMEASMFSMFNMHVRACVCARACACACVHAWDTPPHTHTYPHPHPPICHPPRGVDPRNHLKFDNTSTYQDISIPFEDLKSVKNSHPWVGVWFGGWVGGWVG